MRYLRILLMALTFAIPQVCEAAEIPTTSKIVAVDLFKNGLAAVRREATLGKAGAYVLDDVPDAIHGTYWIDSSTPVESLMRTREVDVPANEALPGNMQDDLAGKKVTIHFRDEKLAPVVGTVIKFKVPKGEEITQPSRFLIVDTAKGRSFIEASEVVNIESETGDGKVKRWRSQLVLTVGENPKCNSEDPRYIERSRNWC